MSSFLKVFAFCMLAGWAYSVAIPADSIAEYCAEIVDDSTYIPVLVKDLNIPVVDWNYPEKFPGIKGTMESPKWVIVNDSWFPCDIDCPEPGRKLVLYRDNPFDNSGACFDCPKAPIKISRISNYSVAKGMVRKKVHLRNARETLKLHYGKAFVGEWMAVFETYGNGRVKPLEQSYSSVLVGECVKNGNSAKMTK